MTHAFLQWSRFTKCTLCDILAKKIPAEQEKEQRELLLRTREAHLQRVR